MVHHCAAFHRAHLECIQNGRETHLKMKAFARRRVVFFPCMSTPSLQSVAITLYVLYAALEKRQHCCDPRICQSGLRKRGSRKHI